MRTKKPPHPPACGGSPLPQGERAGEAALASASTKNGLLSLGARSKRVKKVLAQSADQSSPLAGEGGGRRSRSPGEGGAAQSASTKGARPLQGKHPKETARKLSKTMTDAERKLWSLLRNRKLSGCKFRRQVPIGPYIADFVSFNARLAVEADGGQHFAAAGDVQCDAWFTAQGYRILRFWNSDILANPDGVLARLAAVPSPIKEIAQ